MAPKYMKAALFAGLLAANAHAAVDLGLSFSFFIGAPTRFDPGQEVALRFGYATSAPVDARLFVPLPNGARLLRWSDDRWSCARDADGVRCAAHVEGHNQGLQLIVAAPDDPAGIAFSGTARIESDEPDPNPLNNKTPVSFAVYHLLTVTTPDDFGAGSLRASIERANDECHGTPPCHVTFADSMRVVPQSPLPAITACDLLIDGGGYQPSMRNRSFDAPRRVEISGERAGSGSGLLISSLCSFAAGAYGPAVQGLAIHSFPENGVSVAGAAGAQLTIAGCSIGTDAAGTTAMPNGLRGISVDAPRAAVAIQNCLIAGNTRSGIAVYNAARVEAGGNLIGVRFGAMPMPNGASGIYADGGIVRSSSNTIEYNHDFGIAVGPHAQHVASDGDYIIANGGIAIDWGLDGPSDFPGLPPIPRLTDAFYDAARGWTIVRGVLPLTALTRKGTYTVRAVLSSGDYEGGIALGGVPFITTNTLGNIPFEIQVRGDYTGRRINGQSVFYTFPDGLDDDTSEFGRAIVVR